MLFHIKTIRFVGTFKGIKSSHSGFDINFTRYELVAIEVRFRIHHFNEGK